jgi:hypothetical protein
MQYLQTRPQLLQEGEGRRGKILEEEPNFFLSSNLAPHPLPHAITAPFLTSLSQTFFLFVWHAKKTTARKAWASSNIFPLHMCSYG